MSIVENRKARHDYFIEERYEAGLPRFGGFEAWDQGIRGMVHWLGLGDAAGGDRVAQRFADALP